MPYSIWMNRIQRFLYDVVELYLRIFRRFIRRSAHWTSRRSWRSSCLDRQGLVIRILGQLG